MNQKHLYIVLGAIVVIAIISASYFLTKDNSQNNEISNQSDVFATNNSNTLTENEDNTTNGASSNQTLGVLDISGLDLVLSYPSTCTPVKSDELNRAGSFVSYDFDCDFADSQLRLQEILFYTKQSIAQFDANCKHSDSPCFFGDYPDSNEYASHKTALLQNKVPIGPENFELVQIDGVKYLKYTDFDPNGDFYRYITYAGDTRIEYMVSLNDNEPSLTLSNLSDPIITKFKISN